MFTLKGRQDGFRIILPKEFIAKEIEEKYANVLRSKHSFYLRPIDFLNETIQGLQVFGFENATFQQGQPSKGKPLIDMDRRKENDFNYPHSEYSYRSADSPINLVDKTLNVTFRHTLGYLNYFLLFENFFYQYSRDRFYKDIVAQINIDIFNEKGSIYSRVVLDSPMIHGIDMLDLNYTQPVAQSQTFNVAFKYSNFDFQFLDIHEDAKSEISIEV